MRIDELNTMVAAVCPIISINSDGVIVFDPSATAAQKTAAQGVMATNLPLLNGMPATPPANAPGFISACKTAMGGIVGANALMVAYPAFFPAVQSAAWPDVQALILDAQTKGAITATQYAAFKAAATANNIPVTL